MSLIVQYLGKDYLENKSPRDFLSWASGNESEGDIWANLASRAPAFKLEVIKN